MAGKSDSEHSDYDFEKDSSYGDSDSDFEDEGLL